MSVTYGRGEGDIEFWDFFPDVFVTLLAFSEFQQKMKGRGRKVLKH